MLAERHSLSDTEVCRSTRPLAFRLPQLGDSPEDRARYPRCVCRRRQTALGIAVACALTAVVAAQDVRVDASVARIRLDGRPAVRKLVSRITRDAAGQLDQCTELETRAWLPRGAALEVAASTLVDPRDSVATLSQWPVPFYESAEPCRRIARRERRQRLASCEWIWPITSTTVGASLRVDVYEAAALPAYGAACASRSGSWTGGRGPGVTRTGGHSAGRGRAATFGPRVRCRDGTLSPTCVCGGSLRGCCSHHGGVAGCF